MSFHLFFKYPLSSSIQKQFQLLTEIAISLYINLEVLALFLLTFQVQRRMGLVGNTCLTAFTKARSLSIAITGEY